MKKDVRVNSITSTSPGTASVKSRDPSANLNKPRSWTDEQAHAAIRLMREEGLGSFQAARRVGIPPGSMGRILADPKFEQPAPDKPSQEPAPPPTGSPEVLASDLDQVEPAESPAPKSLLAEEGQDDDNDIIGVLRRVDKFCPTYIPPYGPIAQAVDRLQSISRREWRHLPQDVRDAIETLEGHVFGKVEVA